MIFHVCRPAHDLCHASGGHYKALALNGFEKRARSERQFYAGTCFLYSAFFEITQLPIQAKRDKGKITKTRRVSVVKDLLAKHLRGGSTTTKVCCEDDANVQSPEEPSRRVKETEQDFVCATHL
jgi:hypothetical protein